MNNTRKSSLKTDLNLYISVLITLLFVFCTVLSSSRLQNYLFKSEELNDLNLFYKSVMSPSSIDPVRFWKWRDLNFAGYMVFNKFGINCGEIDEIIKSSGFYTDQYNSTICFLSIHSKNMSSYDFLTTITTIDELNDSNINTDYKVLFKNDRSEIILTKDKKIIIWFIKSSDDLSSVNGFFDSKANDKWFLYDKNWINYTIIDQ